MVKCKACRDTGFVMYHKVVNGIDYEYAALCNCQSAEGKEYDGRTCEKNPSSYYIPKATDVFGVGGNT